MTPQSWGEPVSPPGSGSLRGGPPRPPSPRFVGTRLAPPPVGLLALAGACAVLSAVLLVVTGRAAEIVGYLAGCVGVISFVAGFRYVDQRRRELPTYSPRRWTELATIVLPLIGIVLATAHVWALATELSK